MLVLDDVWHSVMLTGPKIPSDTVFVPCAILS